MSTILRPSALVGALLLLPAVAAASAGAAHDPPPLAVLALILVAAKVGGDVAARAGQPAVLGELLAGVALGGLRLAGWSALDGVTTHPGLVLLGELGVVLLLFEVGLETTIGELRAVGGSAAAVATVGVVTPFALGWAVGALLLPDETPYAHVFLGATLTATSVGITARVLKDLHRNRSAEARIILGAAVIDDVLGLLVLAVVGGLIAAAAEGRAPSVASVALVVGKAVAFLGLALAAGRGPAAVWFGLAGRLRTAAVLLPASLAICFGLAWAAWAAGLAPIVGAFAAGLLVEEAHYAHLEMREERRLRRLLEPLGAFLQPIFFVLMGMRVDLALFADRAVLGFAALLTVAAIAGKQACGLVVRDRHVDRLSIGLGMMPRGEVGLIFASVGLGLRIDGTPIVDGPTYAAILAMVMLTTLATPPALRWSLGRARR